MRRAGRGEPCGRGSGHVLTGRRKDGVYVSMPGVLVGTLKDGKISRLNEYLDSAHVAAFRAQVGSPA